MNLQAHIQSYGNIEAISICLLVIGNFAAFRYYGLYSSQLPARFRKF